MKRIAILLLVLPVFASAQVVDIPDANFKQYLVERTDINTNGDDEIQVSEAILTDSIAFWDLFISDLTGIEAFTALTYLRCAENNLSSLDVSQNTELTYLNCAGNVLSDLNLTGATKLSTLFCAYNWLEDLDVTKNTALTYLNCPNNRLTTLDITQNIVLNSIYCVSNDLIALNTSENTLLTELKCGSNLISSLDVSQNIALTTLQCAGNLIANLDVSKNVALINLICQSNSLESLDMRNGNNINTYLSATSNSVLTCIHVDDEDWADSNWSSAKDAGASFSNDCGPVGIENNQFSPTLITSFNNSINVTGNGTITVYNLTGQRVYEAKINGNTSVSLNKGMYLVKVTSVSGTTSKQVYLY
ncbi:MAG: T9SS type A sorting domain-containing protein [Flavobacteriales bacterium]|nr:T9SS type A sorting domain-containing protein [Flavobacteriales bacterium]